MRMCIKYNGHWWFGMKNFSTYHGYYTMESHGQPFSAVKQKPLYHFSDIRRLETGEFVFINKLNFYLTNEK